VAKLAPSEKEKVRTTKVEVARLAPTKAEEAENCPPLEKK